MKANQGGTQTCCPNCKRVQVATVVRDEVHTESGPNIVEFFGVHWRRRQRECSTCRHAWITAEVEESLLYNLCELRDALEKLRQPLHAFVDDSEIAARLFTK